MVSQGSGGLGLAGECLGKDWKISEIPGRDSDDSGRILEDLGGFWKNFRGFGRISEDFRGFQPAGKPPAY